MKVIDKNLICEDTSEGTSPGTIQVPGLTEERKFLELFSQASDSRRKTCAAWNQTL